MGYPAFIATRPPKPKTRVAELPFCWSGAEPALDATSLGAFASLDETLAGAR
jgi:hypothetical protein